MRRRYYRGRDGRFIKKESWLRRQRRRRQARLRRDLFPDRVPTSRTFHRFLVPVRRMTGRHTVFVFYRARMIGGQSEGVKPNKPTVVFFGIGRMTKAQALKLTYNRAEVEFDVWNGQRPGNWVMDDVIGFIALRAPSGRKGKRFGKRRRR